ncbi:MAG: epimerase [Mycobacterium sp.]
MKIVIAGGTGALGRRIVEDMTARGVDVVVLTRGAPSASSARHVQWDGRTVGAWAAELDGPDTAVINLAGQLVDCTPSETNIAELRRSRVEPTRALVEASMLLDHPVRHWIQGSSTAIWSDAGETRCDEATPLPVGLPQMTGVAKPWEEAFGGANTAHGVILRTSIVLDRDSPALGRLVTLTKLGLGGRVGDGRQWFSWIHRADWLTLVRGCLDLEPGLLIPSGVLVAATAHPVRNRELMATLRRRLHRPAAPPSPAWLLRLGAVALRTDPALGLTGRHATSNVLRESNFTFQFATLDAALADLLD